MRPISTFLWTLLACGLFYLPFSAQAQFGSYKPDWANLTPTPLFAQFNNSVKRSSAPTPTVAETAPSPSVNYPPPVVNVSPPTVNVSAPSVSPLLALPPLTSLEQIQSWLHTGLLALIATFIGKGALWPAPRPVATAPSEGAAAVPHEIDVLLKLRDRVSDPEFKAKVDNIMIAGMSTNLPSTLVRTGLGAIPVAGPLLASGVEPILHDAFMKFLNDRLATNTAPKAP